MATKKKNPTQTKKSGKKAAAPKSADLEASLDEAVEVAMSESTKKTVTNPFNRPVKPIDLFHGSICLSIEFSKPGNVKKIDSEDLEVKVKRFQGLDQDLVDSDMLNVQKHLLDSEEYDRICSYDGKVRNFLLLKALNVKELRHVSGLFKRGTYLIPYELLPEVVEFLDEAAKIRNDMVEDFLQEYPRRVNEAKARLKSTFDESNYPSVEQIRRRFALTYRTFALTTPETLKSLDVKLYQQTAAQMQEDMKDLCVEIANGLRSGLKHFVGKICNALGTQPDGKRNKIYNSNIADLMEFLATFQAKNVADDKDCAILVERAKKLIQGFGDAEELAENLRTNESFRDSMLAEFSTIDKKLSTMVYVDESPDVDL